MVFGELRQVWRSRGAANATRGARTPWLVLTASLVLTLAAAGVTAANARAREQAHFLNAVQSAGDRIAARLDIYETALEGVAALFSASRNVTPEEFRSYVARLDIQREYPGIQGIGWTERLRADPSGGAAETHAIRFLEPLDRRNRAALGFDMYAEPVRRVAMARARDAGLPALSGKVRLVQEIFGPEQAGFLLYVPVYSGSAGPPATLEERRASLLGLVYAPFRADDLFAGIFGSEQEPRVSFEVYDGEQAQPAALLHASARTPGHRPAFTRSARLEIAGRTWTVRYASAPAFEGAVAPLPALILVAGLLVSVWLFLLARAQLRARLAAEENSRAQAAFLATMSHELRTPLNAIAGYVDLLDLELPGPLNSHQRNYLGRVQHAQQHLLNVINDVLSFAKLEAGAVPVTLGTVALSHTAQEAVAMVAPLAAAARLELVVEGGPDVMVIADPEKLRQVLVNLLGNAIKFTDAGGRVAVRWRAQPAFAEIDVEDTGIGIPEDRLDAIFRPFVQAESDLTRTRQGSGLGLAISRELARRMHGTIRVRSEVGTGSTFTVGLPLVRP